MSCRDLRKKEIALCFCALVSGYLVCANVSFCHRGLKRTFLTVRPYANNNFNSEEGEFAICFNC
jgi:hypothetical protein